MEGDAGGKPLRQIAEAFEELASKLSSADGDLQLAPFSHACSLVSVLFGCLGFAFKFAEVDYVAKVRDLMEASKSSVTLQSLLDLDVKSNSVRRGGSHSRNLLRVKRGLDMVKVLFEQILATEGNSLKDPASIAYAQVFAPYHGWAIRKAVGAGMYALPTKAQLLKKLNEDASIGNIGNRFHYFTPEITRDIVTFHHCSGFFNQEPSARAQMQIYVATSTPLIQYVDNLFLSRDLGIEW